MTLPRSFGAGNMILALNRRSEGGIGKDFFPCVDSFLEWSMNHTAASEQIIISVE